MKTTLSEIIKNKIRNQGPISFHDFMEMALYYPELGYYTSTPDKIGKHGDYYTSPYLTKCFWKYNCQTTGRDVAPDREKRFYCCGIWRRNGIIV